MIKLPMTIALGLALILVPLTAAPIAAQGPAGAQTGLAWREPPDRPDGGVAARTDTRGLGNIVSVTTK